jgi:lactate dehydrogenase-like 2-hydroxyacid dehydrogenase
VTRASTSARPVTGLIYVSRLLTDRAMCHLHSLGAQLRIGSEAPPDRAELEAGIAGAGAAVITLTERVDADLLATAGPQLKVIANVAVGFDNIDLSATESAGVTVTNTPGVLDRASADHTFALILDATRRITEGDRLIRSQQPWVWGPRTVLASSRSRTPGSVEDGVTFVDTSTLLAESDVVTVHTPLTAETHHLIDAAAFRAMKPTAYLINTARGGVVDEAALIEALHSGQIRGAALDVFEGEPRVNPALLDAPGLVLTPHTASAGEATRDTMGILAVDNAAAVLAGDPPLTPVR